MRRRAFLRAASFALGNCALASARDNQPQATGGPAQTPQPLRDWTVIHYVAGDNDGSVDYGETLKPLKSHVGPAPGLNWVMLVDLAKGYARYDDVFGEDFHDTRIYELQPGRFVRRGGGDVMPQITTTSHHEANTGDAATLRDFIRYAKKYYPARHYALVVLSHGWGVAFAPDADEKHFGDAIYPAEITDVLSADESVDVMVLDVCQFSSIEAMYQWRPGNGRFDTRWLVASPPGSGSPDYGDVINRITGGTWKERTSDKAYRLDRPVFRDATGDAGKRQTSDNVLGGTKRSFTPAELTPKDFAETVLSNFAEHNPGECWGLYDLAHAAGVKAAVDRLARAATGDPNVRRELEAIRGSGRQPKTMHYMEGLLQNDLMTPFPALDRLLKLSGILGHPGPGDEKQLSLVWLRGPHFDVYDFGRRVADSNDLPLAVRDAGRGVADTADRLVVHSFANEALWPGFVPGKNGAFFVFPDGAATLNGKSHWELMGWYTGADLRPQLAEHHAKLRRSAAYKRLRTVENFSPAELKARRKEIDSRPLVHDPAEMVKFGYGRLSWAIDGATKKDDTVGNWYELLQSWYGKRTNQ